MERLTERTECDDNNQIAFIMPDDPEGLYNLKDLVEYGKEEHWGKVAERLCDLEDKLADGRMTEFPCEPGALIWAVVENLTTGKKELLLTSVLKYTKYKTFTQVSVYIKEPLVDNSIEYDIKEFGHKLFLTREKAEKTLKEFNHNG